MRDKAAVNYPAIGVLSLSHLLNDLYSNYLPQMLPFLVVLIPGFTVTRAALLVSAFTISSSFIQPVFGYFLDGRGQRWLVYVGTLWMAITLSFTGIVHNYALLVVIAAVAGLGTAAFHPQASTMVNVLAGDRKAVLLSIFVACGNFGFAFGPLFLVPLFQRHGLHASVYTVIPGILVAFLLALFAPRNALLAGTLPTFSAVGRSLLASARELSSLVGVIAIRSLAYTGMLAMLPLYFRSRHLSNIAASHLVTIMLLSGAVGGVIGGFISDRFGRKRLIVGSLILATPLFFSFLLIPGPAGTALLALAGAALLSNFSVTVVAAQEAIPDNKALAAGLSMGFAGGLGGLAVILVGRIGDLFGLTAAICLLFALPFVAGLVGLLMTNRPAARSERLSAATR